MSASLINLPKKQNFVEFTSNDTWTVPTGITKVKITMSGGGGGGGAGGGTSGGGGDGGAGSTPQVALIDVVPGDLLTITIGAGGSGGTGVTVADGNDGSGGGSSTVTGTGVDLFCAGGEGGLGGVNNQVGRGIRTTGYIGRFNGIESGEAGAGGQGNTAVVDSLSEGGSNTVYAGTPSSGGATGTGTPLGGGGGGGGSAFGAGSDGAIGANSGASAASNATNPGSGGGGGGGNWVGASGGGNGGDGASGKVIIEY